MDEQDLGPWSFRIEFDETKAAANGYNVETLYDCVGKNVEKFGNERVARGTWRAVAGSNVINAQSLAISKLSRQKWVMQNVKSFVFCEDDDELNDALAMFRRVCPGRVYG